MNRDTLAKISGLVDEHEAWRDNCLNLVAAENVTSPMVRRFAVSDLAGRYGDYLGRDLCARKYYGTQYLIRIEQQLVELIQRVFRARFIEFRPLSGHIAGAAVIMGLTQPGDTVLEVGSDGGGHRLAEKLTHAELARLNVKFLPIDGHAYNLDIPRTVTMVREVRPKLIILGSSNFLFPHPIAPIVDALHEVAPASLLAYDASHVLGLIAGGCFQDPLEEGADVMFGSTHKTFPGPQGGVILSNNENVIGRVSEACYPGLITNHHLARSPALAVAALEMLEFGGEYARAVIANAQSFGVALSRRALSVVGAETGITQSHTVLVQTKGWGTSKQVAARLEASNVIANAVVLPKEQGGEGLRFGVQEITRRGADASTMEGVADVVAAVIQGTLTPEDARPRVQALAKNLCTLRYTFEDKTSGEKPGSVP
jgi:glycine hydroxymethyltransferase